MIWSPETCTWWWLRLGVELVVVGEVAGVEEDACDVDTETMKILTVVGRAPSGGGELMKRSRCRAVSGGATNNAYMAHGDVLEIGLDDLSHLVLGIDKGITLDDNI